MNLDRILKPGMHIEFTFGGPDDEKTVWKARIQANRADSFVIAAPEYMDRAVIAPVGREVVVWAGVDNARCCFDSRIWREISEQGSILLELEKPQKLMASDRRHFVRMKSHLPVKFAVIGPEEIGQWKNAEPVTPATLIDLSGVGLSFKYQQQFSAETRMVFDLPLEMKNTAITVRMLGRVVRSEPYEYSFRVGVRFDNASELQQDLIMKHLFYTMRKNIQINRDDF